MGIILKWKLVIKFGLDSIAQDTFQYLDHANLQSSGFLDPLSQVCDEEHVQNTCNRQLSGTKGGLFPCRLFVQNTQLCWWVHPAYVTRPTTHECHSQSHKFQSYSSVGNSGVGGGSNSNTRSGGSSVFMFYVKTLLVAWVNFIAMKGSLLKEQWSGKMWKYPPWHYLSYCFQVTIFKCLL